MIREFSATRVLGVVLLLSLISVAAVPAWFRSRIVAGENGTVGDLIIIARAQEAYRRTYPQIGYARELSHLSVTREGRNCVPSPSRACFISYHLAHSRPIGWNGYYFEMVASPDNFTVVATPKSFGDTGERSFCITEENIPRSDRSVRARTPESVSRAECLKFLPLR